MNRKVAVLVASMVMGACGWARADFKYTEQSRLTGGVLAGAMKFVGVFSKKAREPMVSTVYVEGNRMRREDAEGKVQIIDLDGRRIISVDPRQQTYSVVTFDQMRQAIERARAKAEAEQKKQAKNPNVKIVPKFQVTPGAGSRVILGQNTHEVKVSVQMEMQSDDPQAQGQKATFWMNSDDYVAPSVPGYEQLRAFNMKMARELDWVPGKLFGGNVQMSSAMAEAAKNGSELKGFPLLQYISFGAAGTGAGEGGPSSAQAQPQAQPQARPANPLSMSPSGLAVKTLGGMFGRHKKKNADEESADAGGGAAGPPPSTPGSLAEMTIEVTSYSNGPLDSSLFDIPAGYRQIEGDINQLAR